MLEVGGKGPAGHTVKTILGQSTRVAVYTTVDDHLRWNYTENNGVVPGDLSPAISKFDSLMAETKSFAPKKHRYECFILLGKSLFAALNGAPAESAINCFRDYEQYLHRLAQQHSRTQYVFECMIVAAIYSIITLLFLHFNSLAHEIYFYGSIFGAVGACISVMQRANDIDIDWTLDSKSLFLQAFIRITLGLLFGSIFILACKGDFLLGAFKDMIEALFLLALVAGLSERMIPDLFGRLEVSGSENA